MKWVELSVGGFVLAGLLAVLFLALRVSGLTMDSAEASYTIHARFSNVSGLAERARVSVAGVPIGKVTAVKLDPLDYRAVVTMEINESVDYLTLDSIASIQTAGVLGEKYISISIGGDEEILADGDFVEDTQPAIVLEELIGKFIANFSKD